MKSTLSFKHYDVIETVYRFNPGSELEEEDVTPDLNLKINYLEENRKKAALIFSVELGDPELGDNSFYIKATIVGIFYLSSDEDEEIPDEFIDHMYKKNALAILYPYMRSLISDLTSKGSENPIILPPINIGAIVEEQDLIIEEYSAEDTII
ncbi:protein-export chaperone SecB [Oceanobacillus sp. FSL H7-0719]|uniref:protein-export chaperone SecB n=1 Tax=Oceanobacillus sp. FSL H7-0719 TaxID=2954507 RepID=UPI00324DB743